MSFTDDDLKRLKVAADPKNGWERFTLTRKELQAFLARLEAAEVYIFQFETNGAHDDNTLRARRKWRNTIGEN